MEWESIPTAQGFLNPRHETLTVLAPTCKSSEALSQAGEGVLFCPTSCMTEAPSSEAALVVFGAWPPEDCVGGRVCPDRSAPGIMGVPVGSSHPE